MRKTFPELKKNLKKDFTALTQVKVALLGDTSTQFLTQALRGAGFEIGLDLQVWEADYNQVEQQILDPLSELFAYQPEVIIIYQSSHKLLQKYNRVVPAAYDDLANDRMRLIHELYTAIRCRLNSRIIYYNYTEINDSVFGNYANKTASSFLFQVRKLNYELMNYAIKQPDFHICDISFIQNQVGKQTFFQPSLYTNTAMVLSIDVLPDVAFLTAELIGSTLGRQKKCLILDLDNTLWGGTLGDDGIENIQLGALGIGKAFTELQYWIKKLQNRGIILAVCSKNTESIAREPFEKHPDMVLSLSDIAVFRANWESKIDNIRQIQSELNIGFESMVFLDDSPFERNLVREHIPLITVPELPDDPADYLEYLYGLNLFETNSFSDEDADRTKKYQTEARRNTEKLNYTDEASFLENLRMVSKAEPFNTFNIPRVEQLFLRSNQFNLRTIRYTRSDIQHIADSADYFTFSFSLADKFDDNGIISAVVLKKDGAGNLFIDNWVMSCRVLKRGAEQFIVNTIVDFARAQHFCCLTGAYLPTPKNGIVKELYNELGFKQEGDLWVLKLSDYQNKSTHINLK